MRVRTSLRERLAMRSPVIQAPLAGGADTPELVAAVSNAGGLGFIGAAYLTPDQIAEASRAVRARTTRPFGINLLAPLSAPKPPENVGPALERIAPYYAELRLPPPSLPALGTTGFEEQLVAAVESGAAVFSFTFGLLPVTAMAAVGERGMLLAGTATTVDEVRPSSERVSTRSSLGGARREVTEGRSGVLSNRA